MKRFRLFTCAVLFAAVGACLVSAGQDLVSVTDGVDAVGAKKQPTYDHQTATYVPKFDLFEQTTSSGSVTPFFSPDNSPQVLTDLCEKATKRLYLLTPSFSSWSFCTYGKGKDYGCTVDKQRNAENFPVFNAVLNAIHRGVDVRILTNNYDQFPVGHQTDPLTFLSVAGASVRFYKSTTFMHAKVIIADDSVAVSSTNFSRASFLQNREAGMVLEGEDFSDFLGYVDKVFESDWKLSYAYKVQAKYTKAETATITDSAAVNVTQSPLDPKLKDTYHPVPKKVTGKMNGSIFASPDKSHDLLEAQLAAAKSTLDVHIYQITGQVCDLIMDTHGRGVNVTALVSQHVFGIPDGHGAVRCYKEMIKKGMKLRMTPAVYNFSHQKYWIVDGKTVSMCTGNMSPSDFPVGKTFPPFPSSAQNLRSDSDEWQSTNRDFTLTFDHKDIVSQFQTVMAEDSKRGADVTDPSKDIKIGF